MHERLPQQRIGAVGDDLIDVHIRLRAAAGLPDGEREVAVERAVKDLVAGGLDRVGTARIEHTKLCIRTRGGKLYDRKRTDDLQRHLLGADAGNFQSCAASARPSNGRQAHAPRPSCHAPDGIPSCNLFSQKSQMPLLYAHLPAHRKPTNAQKS